MSLSFSVRVPEFIEVTTSPIPSFFLIANDWLIDWFSCWTHSILIDEQRALYDIVIDQTRHNINKAMTPNDRYM